MPDRTFAALGHSIAFEERGQGKTTCVLLHGLAGDRALLFDALDGALDRAGLRRLYLDLPGHGASTGELELASADALVEALRLLIAEEGGAAPLLVGHSYGGYLALGLLRDLPTVGGALLVCPVVEPDLGKRHPASRLVTRRDPELAFATDDDNHERATFEEIAVVQTAAVLADYRRLCMPASRVVDRRFVEAVRQRYVMARPVMDSLARCVAPVSIVCGSHDHWVGFEDAAHLLRGLPAASLHVLDGCGQLLPLEQPQRLRAHVDEWLGRAMAPAIGPSGRA